MTRPAKTSQLQIRVSQREKQVIQLMAERAGMDMSAFVLGKVLPPVANRFQDHAEAIAGPESSFAFAEFNRFLAELGTAEFQAAVAHAPRATLTPYLWNYLAAMVEYSCGKREIKVPAWVREVAPLSTPVFGTALKSLRLYLLANSPPPFRFRNIFIDSSVGAGV